MLESASVVRTRIAQVESLSFGRVPELIESSHIWIQIAKSLSTLLLE